MRHSKTLRQDIWCLCALFCNVPWLSLGLILGLTWTRHRLASPLSSLFGYRDVTVGVASLAQHPLCSFAHNHHHHRASELRGRHRRLTYHPTMTMMEDRIEGAHTVSMQGAIDEKLNAFSQSTYASKGEGSVRVN